MKQQVKQPTIPQLPKNYKIAHFRQQVDGLEKSLTGAITIVAKVDSENRVVKYGVAYCRPMDNFSRHEGRRRALKRINSETCRVLDTPIAWVPFIDNLKTEFDANGFHGQF